MTDFLDRVVLDEAWNGNFFFYEEFIIQSEDIQLNTDAAPSTLFSDSYRGKWSTLLSHPHSPVITHSLSSTSVHPQGCNETLQASWKSIKLCDSPKLVEMLNLQYMFKQQMAWTLL